VIIRPIFAFILTYPNQEVLAKLAQDISSQFKRLAPLADVLLTGELLKVASATLELAQLSQHERQLGELQDGLNEQGKKIEGWDKHL
jgi:hypothetical protein